VTAERSRPSSPRPDSPPPLGRFRVVGESDRPTRHRLERSGDVRFVSCAADLLLEAIHGDLSGFTNCPVCGRSIRLRISGGRLIELVPRDVTLYVVEERGRQGLCVDCENTEMFDRSECAEAWKGPRGARRGRFYSAPAYLRRSRDPGFLSARPPATQPLKGMAPNRECPAGRARGAVRRSRGRSGA
jgi:Alkylmercury lyase